MIEGVKIKKLKVIPDERGYLMEMLRCDDKIFEKFGQVYLSVGYPGIVKGWHYHKVQTDHFVFVKGTAKVALYDSREDSKTYGKIDEFLMGEKNPVLLKIPPLVMHGFKAVGTEPAFLINCPTEPYNYDEPDEYRLPYDAPQIGYDWEAEPEG